jgi:hypothetical protein
MQLEELATDQPSHRPPRDLGGRGLPNPNVDAIIQGAQTDPIATGENIVEKQPNSHMCFVCGIENPIGLKLFFYTDDQGRTITRFRPKPEHQGYSGHLHGGIISTLLDEPTQISVLPRILAV